LGCEIQQYSGAVDQTLAKREMVASWFIRI
jgi:hypothetical protein